MFTAADDPTDSIRVLHVDDDPAFVDMAATFLEREDDRFAVETATDASEGIDRLHEVDVDCVVSDYEMPGDDGIAFLETVRAHSPDLPFILFTGKGSEEVASEAISAGVTDYLQKGGGTDQYTVLANRITNAVEHRRSRRMVERSERRLREVVDALPHLLYVVDENGTYLLANEALADFHGTTVEAIEGAHVADVLGDRAAAQFRTDVEAVLDADASRRIPEVELPDSNGDVHVLESRIRPYEFAERRAAIGTAVDVTERKARERELEAVRERMEFALEHTNAVLFEIDLDTDETVRHGTYETFFDHDPDDLPTWQDHCEHAVHPDDRAAFRRYHHELIDGDRTGGPIEYRTNPETGDVRTLRATVRVTDDPDADGRRAVGISRDITEHRERERELERTNTLLSSLFETLPVGLLAEDEDRNVLAVNERMVDLFDLPGTSESVVGADCDRLAEEASAMFADPEEFRDRTAELMATGASTHEEELTLRDGRTFVRSHEPVGVPGGEGHLWTYRDVTDRMEHERRLESLNETFRDLMSAETREAVAELGVEAARDVLGLDANAIHLYDEDREGLVPVAATDALRDLIGDPPTFTGGESIAWRVYRRGEAVALDHVGDDPDVYNPDTPIRSELLLPVGEYGILLAGSPSAEAFDQQDVVLGEILAGNVAGALAAVERTDQLRSRERELTRQNDRLEEFTSVVSHDLRNPLNVAQGRLELAREECDSEHLDGVARVHDRMATLVDDLLALARDGAVVSDLEPVDLGATAAECWGTVSTVEATLRVETDATVRADRSRLQQLLENLFRNSVEHGSTGSQTGSGDSVEHGTAGGQHAPDEATDAGDPLTITVGDLDDGFYVADDGMGVPPDERDGVFDTGYSTSERGTGFGLSIVEQVAEAHGWTVRLTEGEAGGARFEVTGVERLD